LIINKGGKYFGIGASNQNISILSMGLCSDAKGTWDTEVISIIDNGNVGIGVKYPTYKLHVDGTLNASGAVTLGSTLSVGGTTRTKDVYPTEGNHNKYDIGASSNQYRYIYGGWIGSGVGEALSFGANNGYGIYINTGNNVTIGSSDLAGNAAKLYVDGSASAYYFKEKTIGSRRQETGDNWYTIYSASVATQGDNVIIKLSNSYWHQETDSVILCVSIGYSNAMINQLSHSKTVWSNTFKKVRIRKYEGTYYVDVLLHNEVANTDEFFVTGSGKGNFVNFELVTSTDYSLIAEHTLSAGAVSVGGALDVGDNITSAGAITIKDTVYGIGATGVIRGSKLVSEGAIETSTLKVGSILIEDKDGDLFVNGNLAASGSIATKSIGTSSSGGSGTIPWSELENSLIAKSTSYNLGSSAKPWGSVYADSGTINKFTVGSTKIGDTTGYWSITHAGVASFSSVKVNGNNVATEQSVASSLSNYLLKSGGDIEGDLSLFGDYVRFRNCHVLGLSDSGSTQYWGISNVGAASFNSLSLAAGSRIDPNGGDLYIGDANNRGWVLFQDICSQSSRGDGLWSIRISGAAIFQSVKIAGEIAATQKYVQNNFAAKSEAMIEYSVSVTGDRNVAPSLNLDCGNGVWSLRNVYNGTNGDLKLLFDEQQRAQLTPAGDLTISGRLTQSSDETLKNILDYNVDMKVKDIANAPVCYFTWKDRVSDRQIGTIAQYWKLITPECVIGEEGRMSMDYSTIGLVSSIINAREIIKHEDEIEALKRRVKELEDKLAAVSAA
jgi:hypothetical protein